MREGRRSAVATVLFTPVSEKLAFSSLGFHLAYQRLKVSDYAVYQGSDDIRAVLSRRRLSDFDVIFVSVAWEPEVCLLVRCLKKAQIEPRRDRRSSWQPLVIAGGPLTLSNPDLLIGIADAVFIGEADDAFSLIARTFENAPDRESALQSLAKIAGMYVPTIHDKKGPPRPISTSAANLPAFSVFADKPNEFGDSFLVEIGRGCPRKCAFCVVRAGNRKTSFVPVDRIFDALPDHPTRIGLMGAAVSDHPHIEEIVATLVTRGAFVTLGSMRADRVTPSLVNWLIKGGLRTLTVAADGMSEALRESLKKGVTADDLIRCASIAGENGLGRLKLYVMIGLPEESDDDVFEFANLVTKMTTRIRVVLSVSPFVPKRFTPLENAPFAGAKTLKQRFGLLKKALRGAAEVTFSSPREAEIEWRLSQARGESAIELVEHLASRGCGQAKSSFFKSSSSRPK